MSHAKENNELWEEKYQAGHAERYPWDVVVSFVFRNYPRGVDKRNVKILEVGCGTGSNLWFAAREGFNVTGIESSKTAIRVAGKLMKNDGLHGDLRVGDFTALPFEADLFDLVIDRGAITCVGRSAGKKAVAEIKRVLKKNGKFLFNPYSDNHTSCLKSEQGPDGVRQNIKNGTLIGVGQICFYNRKQVTDVLQTGWAIRSLQHIEIEEFAGDGKDFHCEWRVVAEKL